MRFSTKKMIITGGLLLLISVIVSALRVAKILPASFIFDFFSYACLVAGTFIGMMGIFTHVKGTVDSRRSSDYRHRKP